MDNKNTEINKDIDSSNIFDDFTKDSTLVDEVDKIKRERNRDLFFYIAKISSYLQVIFWLGLVLVVILFSYISIQNNENLKDSTLLDPFCFIFLGNVENEDYYCSSISSLKLTYSNKLSSIRENQTIDIINILNPLYEIENFIKTKEVSFLVEKSNNKLEVLYILEAFDDIKNDFDVDKQKIQCNSLIIDGKNDTLSMKCNAYSAGFEKGLRGFDGTTNLTLKGSSLSIANSFINYIEKINTPNIFTVIDRQKIFRSETTLGQNTDFTNMTTFSLKLKYNLK